MTLRKLDKLFDCYCHFYSIKTSKSTTIDDIIPEGV